MTSAFSRHILVWQRGAVDVSGAVALAILARLEAPGLSSSGALGGGSGGAPFTRLFIAHVGDVRAVLSRRGLAIDVSRDHRVASRPDEVARVVAAGGWVRGDRVLGVLGITRAFGDAEFKGGSDDGRGGGPSEHSVVPREAAAAANGGVIIAEPDIRVVDVAPLDEFLIIGAAESARGADSAAPARC